MQYDDQLFSPLAPASGERDRVRGPSHTSGGMAKSAGGKDGN
jgi:hypothetical protein